MGNGSISYIINRNQNEIAFTRRVQQPQIPSILSDWPVLYAQYFPLIGGIRMHNEEAGVRVSIWLQNNPTVEQQHAIAHRALDLLRPLFR